MPDSVADVSAPPMSLCTLRSSTIAEAKRTSVSRPTYESDIVIDAAARFDSHLTIYSTGRRMKTVDIQYDILYIRGLLIRVRVDEVNEHQ